MKKIIQQIGSYFNLGIKIKKNNNEESATRSIYTNESVRLAKPRTIKDKKENLWTFGMFVSTILGVFSKYIFGLFSNDGNSTDSNSLIVKLFLACIISIVIFPAIYKKTSMNTHDPNFLHLCVSFQNGFFWQTLIGELNV